MLCNECDAIALHLCRCCRWWTLRRGTLRGVGASCSVRYTTQLATQAFRRIRRPHAVGSEKPISCYEQESWTAVASSGSGGKRGGRAAARQVRAGNRLDPFPAARNLAPKERTRTRAASTHLTPHNPAQARASACSSRARRRAGASQRPFPCFHSFRGIWAGRRTTHFCSSRRSQRRSRGLLGRLRRRAGAMHRRAQSRRHLREQSRQQRRHQRRRRLLSSSSSE